MNTLPSEPQRWYASLFLSHPVACTLYESVGKHWTERAWRSGERQHCLLVGISFASYPLSNLVFPVLALNQKSLHFEQTPALYLDQTRPLLARWTVIVSLSVNIYQFVFVSLGYQICENQASSNSAYSPCFEDLSQWEELAHDSAKHWNIFVFFNFERKFLSSAYQHKLGGKAGIQ